MASQFSEFIQASVGHLDNIIGLKFSSYANDVPASVRKTDKLEDDLKQTESVTQKAAIQQAIDIVQASNRAVAMRQLSHQDYIQAYRASAPERKAYLERRESAATKLIL